jgi:glutamate-ammonia-ligase adenylyltransferase
MTKVRFAAGDPGLAREFIRAVQPFVYTSHANFDAIQTAQDSRQKMHVHRSLVQPSLRTIDVKSGQGGIRDIEFLVQCLQRVHGGAEPWLRSAGTMSCLQKLCDKQHLSSAEFGELSSAYELLRHLEHRLQLRYGQQTHQLPASEEEMQILQRAMKPYLGVAEDTKKFELFIRRRMASVSETCERVLARQQAPRKGAASGFELSSPPTQGWSASQEEILKRLSRDAPAIYEIAKRSDLSAYARRNLFLFLNSAMSSSERYGGLLREASGLAKSLPIFETSEYLTKELIRHPEHIAIIAGLETGSRVPISDYLFENIGLLIFSPEDPVFSYVASSNLSYGEKLAMLRRHSWQRNLSSGARDVIEGRAVYDSLAQTTGVAEEAIRTAFSIAGAPSGFAVMAVGRLGSGEFDVLSDADLIFVGTDRGSVEFRKAAQQIVHILSAYTRDGSVFPVDTRLRPRGNDGDILVLPSDLESYCETEAHSWEALVYSKMRFVAGSRVIADQALRAVQRLFERFAQVPDFSNAVHEMRRRLELSDVEGFKTRPGGIYDIDFLSSFLMIRHAIPNKNGTLRDRLWRLSSAGVLEKTTAAALDHAAEFLRTVEHVTRLITGRPSTALPGTAHGLQVAQRLTSASLRENFPESLQRRYEQTSAMVREIFEREVSRN